MPPRLSLDVVSHGRRPTTVTALAASPHGELLVPSAAGGRCSSTTPARSTCSACCPFPEGVARVVRFSRNAKLLLAGGGEAAKSGRVVALGRRHGEANGRSSGRSSTRCSPPTSRPTSGSWPSAGRRRWCGCSKTADGGMAHEIRKHTDWITALEFSPDGKRLATGDRAGNLFLWETRGGPRGRHAQGPRRRDHGRRLAARRQARARASREDGSARLWDAEGRQADQDLDRPRRRLRVARLAARRPAGHHRPRQEGEDLEGATASSSGSSARSPTSARGWRPRATRTRIFAGDWTGDARRPSPRPTASRPAGSTRIHRSSSSGSRPPSRPSTRWRPPGRRPADKVGAAAEAMQVAESQMAAARQAHGGGPGRARGRQGPPGRSGQGGRAVEGASWSSPAGRAARSVNCEHGMPRRRHRVPRHRRRTSPSCNRVCRSSAWSS